MVISKLVGSLGNAVRGLKQVFKTEPNFRLQIVAGIAIIALMIYLPLQVWEIAVLIILMTLVLVLELLNSAVEYLADLLKPRLHHYISSVKDIMAAAVLLCAFAAVAIGFMIFLPYFLILLE